MPWPLHSQQPIAPPGAARLAALQTTLRSFASNGLSATAGNARLRVAGIGITAGRPGYSLVQRYWAVRNNQQDHPQEPQPKTSQINIVGIDA